jgi:hypothetical protein
VKSASAAAGKKAAAGKRLAKRKPR